MVSHIIPSNKSRLVWVIIVIPVLLYRYISALKLRAFRAATCSNFDCWWSPRSFKKGPFFFAPNLGRLRIPFDWREDETSLIFVLSTPGWELETRRDQGSDKEIRKISMSLAGKSWFLSIETWQILADFHWKSKAVNRNSVGQLWLFLLVSNSDPLDEIPGIFRHVARRESQELVCGHLRCLCQGHGRDLGTWHFAVIPGHWHLFWHIWHIHIPSGYD